MHVIAYNLNNFILLVLFLPWHSYLSASHVAVMSISCLNFKELYILYPLCRDLSENQLVGPIPPILGNLSYTGKL